MEDGLRTAPAEVGRRNVGATASAGPGRGRRRRRDRLGRLGRLNHRSCASSCGGCPHRPTAGTRFKGGRRVRTSGRNAVAESARPPGGGGTGGEGLGRSRGGFTTKLHLSADGRCRPMSLIVTPGQRADCTQFKPVPQKIRVPKPGPGRPARSPTASPPTRPTATDPAVSTCGAGASGTRSRRRPTARPPAYAKAHAAGGRPASTKSSTRNATPSSGPSTGSSSTGRWPPATTSVVTSTWAPPPPQPTLSGSAHDRPDKS
jgi:hypothetical protein